MVLKLYIITDDLEMMEKHERVISSTIDIERKQGCWVNRGR